MSKAEDSGSAVACLKAKFRSQFAHEPQLVARAPGRVNLIGEHTDYNEGFVLPAAIDKEMLVAASRCTGESVRVYSAEYEVLDEFLLENIERSASNPWSDYLRGMLSCLSGHGYRLGAFNAVLSGNVPQGAGLSSSAAYEVAVGTAVAALFDLPIKPKQIALLSQEAENDFIGVKCGIMDQFISALAAADCALFIDCRTLAYKPVPLNLQSLGISIVIVNSGVRRGLVDSEYNARANECAQGVELLSKLLDRKLSSLRDCRLDEFDRAAPKLPAAVGRRCLHVITENERVLRAAEALQAGRIGYFGDLMSQSHRSLRDDFQVSCPELDALVELAQSHAGVLGARMTGAGFGGCMVALLESAAVEGFAATVLPAYSKRTGKQPKMYVCSAAAGASLVQSAEAVR